MSVFPERLRALRKERGLSSQSMADLLNITLRAYQFYEQGEREPKYDKLILLVNCLETSADYLLGLKDEPK